MAGMNSKLCSSNYLETINPTYERQAPSLKEVYTGIIRADCYYPFPYRIYCIEC
jgi:hypothetical protein